MKHADTLYDMMRIFRRLRKRNEIEIRHFYKDIGHCWIDCAHTLAEQGISRSRSPLGASLYGTYVNANASYHVNKQMGLYD